MKTHSFTTTVTPADFTKWPFGDEPTQEIRVDVRGSSGLRWALFMDEEDLFKLKADAYRRIHFEVHRELDRLEALAEDAADARREERMLEGKR